MIVDQILANIRDIPDYPTAGVLFKDITPLLADGPAFADVVELFVAPHRHRDSASAVASVASVASVVDASVQAGADATVDVVVGIEARGFILAAPVAIALGAGFVPVRKKGKLPYATVGASYHLEYGTAEIELHTDGIRPGQRVLVVDDVLATGGTAEATCGLIERLGGVVTQVAVLLELTFLNGREKLSGRDVRALVTV